MNIIKEGKNLWRGLWLNPWQPVYMVPLVIINITGSAYGYWWYRAQLDENPWYLWPLISDSPLATTFFALALVLALLGRRCSLLTAVGMVTTIKYGAWALVILTHYWLEGGGVRLVEAGLWLGHLGMVLQGIIFMRGSGIVRFTAAGAVLWMIINDAVDYIFGVHPYLYMPGQETLAAVSALVLTVLSGAVLWKRGFLPAVK